MDILGLTNFNSISEFPTQVKSTEEKWTAKNRFFKREPQIFRPERTEMDLSIWLLTEISGIFGIMENTQSNWSQDFLVLICDFF